jgi:acetyltransferase-like isoleucine patch superfamily enzyme
MPIEAESTSTADTGGHIRWGTLLTLAGLLPQSSTKIAIMRLAGADIAAGVRVGPSIIMGVRRLVLRSGACIGFGNVIRDVELLALGDNSAVGQWNWVSASRLLVDAGGSGGVTIGAESAITSRHYLDASGGIEIGHHTTIAGVRSSFLTHGISWQKNVQRTSGILIGDYCLIGSNTAVTPGTRVGAGSVVGMGAVLAGDLPSESLLLSERARAVKHPLPGDYFTRVTGRTRRPGRMSG